MNSVENKSNIPKRSTSSEKSATNECASKKEKKSAFNLNAKEYVPVRKETLKLNSNAKEYLPPKISAKSSNAESEDRDNLFDNIPNPENNKLTPEPEQNTYGYSLPSGSELNKPVVKYSEEDKVSIDFVPDYSLVSMK